MMTRKIKKILFSFGGIFLFHNSLLGMSLEYVQSTVAPTVQQFEGTRIGGLSSLIKKDDLYWAVSDDKGQFGEPRLYGFQVEFDKGQLLITPQKMLRLLGQKEQQFRARAVDFEGAIWSGSSWIVASEGAYHLRPKEMPSLMEFDKEGGFLKRLDLSADYLPEKTGSQKKGMRNNGAFEGLSLSPSGETLWVATEQPLVQDEPDWLQGRPGQLRLLKYKRSKGVASGASPDSSGDVQWIPAGEWLYPLSGVKGENGKWRPFILGHGCSDIFAISDDEILFLERSAFPVRTGVEFQLQLFLTKISEADKVSTESGGSDKGVPDKGADKVLEKGASDKLPIDKLTTDRLATDKTSNEKVANDKPVNDKALTDKALTEKTLTDKTLNEGSLKPLLNKSLVFDFSSIKDKIVDHKGLDNLEGFSFGPSIGGSPSLLFVADDNFNGIQRNLWILLKIKPD